MHLINILIITFLSFFFVDSTLQNTSVFFYDSFENLKNWESFKFSSGKKPTDYKIITENENFCLQIKSDSSASGLICKTKFNPTEFPFLKWKWKVENIIPNADGKVKAGDDYSIRIFVMIEKESTEISFWEKIKKNAIQLISEFEPPYKNLCYVWSNSKSDTANYFSPYSNDVMIIPKQSGSDSCNKWIEEQINIVDDYKKYFKEKVPPIACISIMGDSDNSKSQSLSFIEFLEIK